MLKDKTILKVARDIDRHLSRREYEDLLIELGLYSKADLAEYSRVMRNVDFIQVTLQITIIQALYKKDAKFFSSDTLDALWEEGINLGQEAPEQSSISSQIQSGTSTLPDYKRRTLESRRTQLIKEYEAASAQLSRALSDVDRLRLQSTADDLDRQIQEIDAQLGKPTSVPIPENKQLEVPATIPADDRQSTIPSKPQDKPPDGEKQWWQSLWLKYVVFLAMSLVGLVADLGQLFGLSSCVQFWLFTLGALIGGIALLVYSALPVNRKKYKSWDRILTGVLTLVATVISMGLICQHCSRAFWCPSPPTPTLTPSPTVKPTSTSTPSATPTTTNTPTSTPSATPTPTATSTPTLTPTPTPDPVSLVMREKEAVLNKDMDLIREIFAPDATKTDGATSQWWTAIERYGETFASEDYIDIVLTNFTSSIHNDTVVVTHDSCGSLIIAGTGQKIDFHCPQCNQWTLKRDSSGRWWIVDFTYNLVSQAPVHIYSFEDGTNGCWAVRFALGVPQGEIPVFTNEAAYKGTGSIRFNFDLARTDARVGQTIVYNMPFAGKASAYIYAPSDAPADLEAGFFAMEYDHVPWNYHAPDQVFALKPGKWTRITWDIGAASWAHPLHFLGIEVRQAREGNYKGYILIDEVTIVSQ